MLRSLESSWLNSPIGPYLQVFDNRMKVARDEAPGWGNVLLKDNYNKGKIRIVLFVESVGEDGNMLVGVF